MSHHLGSPITRQDIRLDTTDLYVFRGEVGTALVINVCHSIASAAPGPVSIRKGCTRSRSNLMTTPSRRSRIASNSTSAMRLEGSG